MTYSIKYRIANPADAFEHHTAVEKIHVWTPSLNDLNGAYRIMQDAEFDYSMWMVWVEEKS